MGTSGEISNYSLQREPERPLLYERSLQNTQNLQVCKLCFLENTIES